MVANDGQPAIGVPRPHSNGTVDNGAPAKDKDEQGRQASSLGSRAEGDHRRDGSEHGLVKGVDQRR